MMEEGVPYKRSEKAGGEKKSREEKINRDPEPLASTRPWEF